MRTPLYDHHLALGAKMVPFSGWDMPLHYQGILHEHQIVREHVGLFDVSHMGRISVKGPDAERLLNFLSTNQIAGKKAGSATYTVLCYENGGCVDDTIIYKIDENHFFLIANASNREKDFAHLSNYASQNAYDVQIEESFSQTGIIALQGPKAQDLLTSFIPEIADLKPMQFMLISNDEKGPFFVARCGYTGSGGYELYGNNTDIIDWWEKLLERGKEFQIEPIGLGARDSLRLEVGFALYGHELSDSIFANDSIAAWTIKWEKPNFLGKEALLKHDSSKKFAYGICLLEGGIPRQDYLIFKDQIEIGVVTSGGFSPGLNKGIALILSQVPLQLKDIIAVQIRQTFYPAEVVELPFVRKTG
ncbi:MAG: glycine cleavage system aminomethyltransferase GcvT [Parachlamydiaceae bacterium]|nr:glycine cleavage system aminomethyltransferase GcvT [Parachlamydiaceae bacterium]